MNFENLGSVIKVVIHNTFATKYELVNCDYDPDTESLCGCWYIHAKGEDRDIILQIPRFMHSVQYSIIKDLETFNKEFWRQPDKIGYLICNDKIIDYDHYLNPYQAYRFISEIKDLGIRLDEFNLSI